ncbi:AAA family ATPase [Streptomyces lunaelactis]|uniref:ATP-dependent nuclease n=1 Tax=Streptomyces lunaelactis TaxID=1535768 RepID=UPI001585B1F8|nr:AAA family ATPase [Streptomyces lunaelactis]NUK08651.1 AAA family ATPase [Streptomyces lunaelactis]NUL10742.1 AAA family ATPase [Streptomyces lunaelactis]NUL22568.1 AAA family ATPase [Streptomyces lunaelactis]
MYLAEVSAENFRIYGPRPRNEKEDDKSLKLSLRKGLSVLIGENDSGKTAIIDAIRYCLQTTANDFSRITQDDFYCNKDGRSSSFSITCKFQELSDLEQATFLELLTTSTDEPPLLYVTLKAQILDPLKQGRISTSIRTGPDGEGPALEGSAREFLRATYLKPLRDAQGELRSGRSSRLSQILASYPEMQNEETDDFDTEADTAKTLVGLLKRMEHHIAKNPTVSMAREDINTNYLGKFGIGDEQLLSVINVASDTSLTRALERLELNFALDSETGVGARRGLGYSNALFMAAELLLLSNSPAPLLLIEEPEAHLHPQLQARVMDLLMEKAIKEDNPVQVILTTHSPNIAASIPVERLTLVSRGAAFSLQRSETKLDSSDYAFLHRFLDVTKSNLFFARGVAIVEGDAEAILLPTLASSVGHSFSKAGVSVVNVGHVGLFRYARIFQRKDDRVMPIKAACIRDRDIVPAGTPDSMRGNLPIESSMTEQGIAIHVAKLKDRDGGSVKTFVSDYWTLEYDLAAASWKLATLMHQAIQCAKASTASWPEGSRLSEIETLSAKQVMKWKEEGRSLESVAIDIYQPLKEGNASKPIAAQHAARLVPGATVTTADLPSYLLEAFTYLCGPKS